MDDQKKDEGTEGKLMFIKEIAKYFRDFLETDFYKYKFQKRAGQLKNEDGVLMGFNLQKYLSFRASISQLVNADCDKNFFNKLEKVVYKTNEGYFIF
ncbi:MAG: hypothetical protein WC052_00825 [Patescibacteria group bacterium]|jgi:hypothetical protein